MSSQEYADFLAAYLLGRELWLATVNYDDEQSLAELFPEDLQSDDQIVALLVEDK